jgi:threonine dehydratase
MIESLKAGRILDLPSTETLSDGTAGGVEQDSITFGLCQELIDECVTVSEPEIRGQLRQFISAHQMLIEGAAAVAIASLIKTAPSYRGQNVVVVLCGANIGFEKLVG